MAFEQFEEAGSRVRPHSTSIPISVPKVFQLFYYGSGVNKSQPTSQYLSTQLFKKLNPSFPEKNCLPLSLYTIEIRIYSRESFLLASLPFEFP